MAETQGAKGSMTVWSVTAMGIGAMVGAGIFALLGQVALLAGEETYVAFILAGVVALLSGYSFAKLGVRYPDAGGLSTFFDKGFGIGRVSGSLSLIYLLTLAVSVALLAKAFGSYAAPLLGGGTNQLWIDVFASGITLVLLLLNIAGAKLVGKTEVVLVGIKLLILATLMVAGGIGMTQHARGDHLHPGLTAIAGSVGFTFLAYAGFGMMSNAAASVPKPQTTIPRAIYLAIAIVMLLYVGLGVVVLGNVTPAGLAQHPNTAVADAATPVLGHAGYLLLSAGALLATASGINAYLFGSLKISKAMAAAKQLPKLFSQTFWKKGSRGYLLGAAAVLVAVNTLDLTAIATVASATFLIVYLAVHVAHWRLIKETKGSRALVAAGMITMGMLLVAFLWTSAVAQPWVVAFIGIFVVGSWTSEVILERHELAAVPAAIK
jgi:amino acid transporter